jgi:hypothetical protein
MRNCDSNLRSADDSAPIAMLDAEAAENRERPVHLQQAQRSPRLGLDGGLDERLTADNHWLLAMPPSRPAVVHATNHITKWLRTSIRYCPPMLVCYASAVAGEKALMDSRRLLRRSFCKPSLHSRPGPFANHV